jgi:phosphate transport system substrate-binding protein
MMVASFVYAQDPIRLSTCIAQQHEAWSTMEKQDVTSEAQRQTDTIAGFQTAPNAGESPGESFEFLAPARGPDHLGWLGSYKVVKLLGAGGMGLVFHAEDSQLLRPVALKVVRPQLAKDPGLRERFLREARAMAALKCDHVVTVHQVGEANELPFLAMEFLEGESLEQTLEKGRRPDVATVLQQGKEIALGLAAAHERGLIHRDIKPANVFLERSTGRVKILDFGLAKPARQQSGLTEAGMIIGTPDYMAPEQADGGEISERTDLFSLGCVLYQLLAGEPPFAGPSIIAVLKAVALHNPRPLQEVNSSVPPALANLVMKLMAKNPADRPASAREVADDLDAIARDPNSPRLHSRQWKAKPAALIALAVVLLAGLGFGNLPQIAAQQRERRGLRPRRRQGGPQGPTIRIGADPANPVPVVGSLNAGGSTFIEPLMEKWASIYRKENGIKLNYVPTGSGAGIQQLTSQALDFCCSDVPMSAEQLTQARANGGDVLHVPLALGGIVPAYNLPGLSKPLRFSGSVLAGIYLGDIKKWNDPAVQELNPDVDLPDLEILVIHRADSSGSTYIFTDFLGKVSKDWQKKVGTAASVKWPVGTEARGNEGMVEALVKKPGTIAYVELLYALRMKLMFGAVKNKQGNYLQGNLDSVTAAAEGALADIPADLRFSLTNAPGKNAYPICGCTWAILYVKQPPGKGQRIVDFLRWVTQDGQEFNTDLFYAQLPQRLAETAEQKLKQVKVGE